MKRRLSAGLAGALLLVPALAWAEEPAEPPQPPEAARPPVAAFQDEPPAPAEPTAEARKEASERFQRGLRLYEDGDYNLALIEFERAYQLVPDFRVLYNIGQVAISLGRFARARVALETYLAEGGEQLSDDRRNAVERDVEMLRGRTAHLSVRTEPEGAEILIDDVSYGVTPLAGPLLVEAGEHRVLVRRAGHQSKTQRIVLAGAEALQLDVVLEPDEENKPVVIVREAEPPVQAPRLPVGEQTPGLNPVLVGWTATGVLTAGAVVSGVMVLSIARQHEDLMGGPDPDQAELQRLATRSDRWELATDILAASAAVAAGVSIYFMLSSKDDKKDTARRQGLHSVELRSAGSSVSVLGRF